MLTYKKYFAVLVLLCLQTILNAQTNTPSTTVLPLAPTQTIATVPASYNSNNKVNFVRTWVPQMPINNTADVLNNTNVRQVQEATQYFDGLGRPLQTVAKKMSSSEKDIVSMHVYDAFGRETLQYMPYVQTTGGAIETDGKFKLNPFANQASFLQTQYVGEQVFYNQTILEASPLNRPLKTMAAGNSWAGSNRGVSMSYEINAADEVRLWNIATTNAAIPTSSSFYLANQLYRTVTTDEHNKHIVEYKDKEGKVVLKKVQIDPTVTITNHAGWLCTYYIYDDFGLLRFVIPPKAVNAIIGSTWVVSSSIADELCFNYDYDARNRMIAKKVPGVGWVYMVYDKRDRLVFTQDANMRLKSPNQWAYILYDVLNRPVQTGIMQSNQGRAALQTHVDGVVTGTSTLIQNGSLVTAIQADLNYTVRDFGLGLYQATNSITLSDGFTSEDGANFVAEIVTGTNNTVTTNLGISDNPVPSGATLIPLTYSFYDNYAETAKTYSAANNAQLVAGTNTYPETLPTTASTAVKGMPTVSRVRVLENPNDLTLGKWMETATFYDAKGRPIQVVADNYKGGQDVTTNLYDFSGKVLSNYTIHNNPSGGVSNLRVLTTMEYDHAGRLLKVEKTINNVSAEKRTIVENTYNELGQLQNKKIGRKKDVTGTLTTDPLEDQSYTYNIRGWLKGINWNYQSTYTGAQTNIQQNKWFAFDLSYDWGFNNNQYNGNIAGQRWMSAGDATERSFGYGYDHANRLLYADFKQNNGSASSPLWNNYITGTTGHIDFTTKMGDGLDYTKAYDANGNILQMQHHGLNSINNSALIDDLRYTYYSNSNKLQNVIDIKNDAYTKLGDFRTATTHPQYTIKNDINTPALFNVSNPSSILDYGYDVNGNLITDRNKNIAGNTGIDQTTGGAIVYNHLNLPYSINIPNKGTITYVYDAVGKKLEKRVTDNTPTTGTKTTQTTYIGGYIYENNSLQFFGHEEGRVRKVTLANGTLGWAFDYMLKDNLGNVRAVLTEEKKQDVYPATTLEDGAVGTEGNYYDIKSGNIQTMSSIAAYSSATGSVYSNNNGNPPYNNNPNSNTTANSQKMYRLNGATGDKTGLGIALKVMAGDVVNIFGKSYWHDNLTTPIQNNQLITTALQSFLSSFTNTGAVAGGAHGTSVTGATLYANGGTSTPLQNWLNNTVTTISNKPKANINWILFDERFIPVSSSSGFVAIGATDIVNSHTGTANITKNGYLYVYCSNESNINVFFDNLQVIHNKGALLEETHYYPFGLTMSGISSKAAGGIENKKKYNGIEYENSFDVNIGEAFFRTHDPQIGRWWQIDPKPKMAFSPYASMENNPILYKDYLGNVVDLSNTLKSDEQNKTNYTQKIIDDLRAKTGLRLSIVDGKLTYEKDKNGNVVFDSRVDGKKVSETARNTLVDIIGKEDVVTVRFGKTDETKGNEITLSPKSIQERIDGAKNGLDPSSRGWGMTFLHETYHTKAMGELNDPDPITAFDKAGAVEDKMNNIRNELGSSFGQRVVYATLFYNAPGGKLIFADAMDKAAYDRLMNGDKPTTLYIEYPDKK